MVVVLILEKAVNHGEHGDTAKKQGLAQCACITQLVICARDEVPCLLAVCAGIKVVQMRFLG
jgi:hypothetical protein